LQLPAAPSYVPEPDADSAPSEDDDAERLPSQPPAKKPKKPEALIPVVNGLRKLYPEEKMAEISTSFTFICLLHLCNEQGLRIQTPLDVEGGSVDDGLAMRKRVGGLEGLRVFSERRAVVAN